MFVAVTTNVLKYKEKATENTETVILCEFIFKEIR